MKQGWEIKKIKDICEKASSDIAQNKITSLDGDYPVYGASGFVQNVDFYHRDTEYIGIVKDGSGVGRVNIYPAYSSLLGTLQYIIPKQGYSLNFVAYALKSLKLADFASGAAIPHIYFKDYGEVAISVPSLAEQERIVEVLDREFEKIDAMKANAEQNLQHAKDLFQAALRQELKPKEGWYISTLQEMLKLTSGDNLTAKSIINGDYPVYGGNGIMGYHNHYNLDGINVIVGRVGALCGNVRLVEGKIWYTDNAFLVHDKKNIFYLPFLTYELQNANLRQYATQAAQPVVSNASMKDVVLAVPPSIKEQEGIVARLDNLNERCKALEENYKKTIALCDDMKQALLRKAFNGEL